MAETRIEWADKVWNPVTGCTRVSQGCKNCYAERMAARLQKMGQPHYANGFQVAIHEDALVLPLRWRKPAHIFVNSMSDLFHSDVPDAFILRVWWTMAQAQQHTFLVLTKRAERMLALLRGIEPLVNVWMGVSVENQRAADERIPPLLATPAAIRFLSCEPLLGPVDLTNIGNKAEIFHIRWNALDIHDEPVDQGIFSRFPGIDWVIAGGESGPKARPMHPDWARSLRNQCQVAGVPFFFKQWGEWSPTGEPNNPGIFDKARFEGAVLTSVAGDQTNTIMARIGRREAGDVLDGRQWHEYPNG